MKHQNVSLTTLGVSLGMFEFSLKKRLERGLTDAETQQILSILKGGKENE
jgi:hypothetical protein